MKTLGIVLVILLLAACEREQRRFSEVAPSSGRPEGTRQSELAAGGAAPAAPVRNPYEENAWAVGEGKRLYQAFNCNGCHFQGGGGMGPALMDKQWIYGGDPRSIYETIAEGRPNGMPAFGSRIGEQQVWQLVAYVQALGGELRFDVRPGRDDHMQARESEQTRRHDNP